MSAKDKEIGYLLSHTLPPLRIIRRLLQWDPIICSLAIIVLAAEPPKSLIGSFSSAGHGVV